MRIATLAAALALITTGSSATAGSVPVVLAVDTSLSLAGADLSAAVESLRAMVRQLPADTEVGAVEFGDDTRWLVRPNVLRDKAISSLEGLEPTGRITLLNDALFQTAKALPAGGVIVLATDGRDEGSATTPEDVARLCNINIVRIVTLGVGRRIDDRALRRLSLLTDGSFVGPQPFAQGTDLLIAVEAARRSVSERVARNAPPTPMPTRPPVVPPRTEPASSGESLPVWVPTVVAIALVFAVTAVLLWRRQRREEKRVCERCGLPLEVWDTDCPHCRAEAERNESEIREKLDRERLAEAVAVTPPANEDFAPELWAKRPLDEPVDKTSILGEQVVLVVKEHRKPPQVFRLVADEPFSVGRAAKVNTVAIADPTMSAQHFRIAFKEGAYYVADLETTNGTLVNGERIHVHKLRAGDQIRAGEVDFEFRVQYQKRI
jgi:hypothetical protein